MIKNTVKKIPAATTTEPATIAIIQMVDKPFFWVVTVTGFLVSDSLLLSLFSS